MIKKVNNKQWSTYDHDQQRKALGRIEASFRSKNPSVVLHRIEYEICPASKNIHFHALYEMPELFVSTLQNYWDKFNVNDSATRVLWRHLDIRPCTNIRGWLEYITKTL